MTIDKKSAFWKLSARVEREGDVIRLILNPGPSGDVYKTLKEYKITQVSDEDNLYLKRIIKNNFIICEEKIKGSANKSDKDIVSIIQSLHIAKKVNKDRWKVDMDYIKTQFAKDKFVSKKKKPSNLNKNKGKFDNKNKQNRQFSPAQHKQNNTSANYEGFRPNTGHKVIIKPKSTSFNENRPAMPMHKVRKVVRKKVIIKNPQGE